LRSGEYQQTTGTLRAVVDDGNYSFCCLGVLCDIDPTVTWRRSSEAHLVDTGDYIGEGDLTMEGTDHFGLDSHAQQVLVRMNDGFYRDDEARDNDDPLPERAMKARAGKRYSFAEIADFIEANL
jgi:hypothetical protein